MAAILGAGAGLFVLGAVTLATEVNHGFSDWVFAVGKSWIPGAEGIGPYSGKETFLLLGWLVSWVVLHVALRSREVDVRLAFGVFLAMVGGATLMIWPPVWHALSV